MVPGAWFVFYVVFQNHDDTWSPGLGFYFHRTPEFYVHKMSLASPCLNITDRDLSMGQGVGTLGFHVSRLRTVSGTHEKVAEIEMVY